MEYVDTLTYREVWDIWVEPMVEKPETVEDRIASVMQFHMNQAFQSKRPFTSADRARVEAQVRASWGKAKEITPDRIREKLRQVAESFQKPEKPKPKGQPRKLPRRSR